MKKTLMKKGIALVTAVLILAGCATVLAEGLGETLNSVPEAVKTVPGKGPPQMVEYTVYHDLQDSRTKAADEEKDSTLHAEATEEEESTTKAPEVVKKSLIDVKLPKDF